MTKVIKVDPFLPDSKSIVEAAECIRSGGLVAFPTETVYGLGANAFDQIAVKRIYEAKQRPGSDPIIVHISEVKQIFQVANNVNVLVLQLIDRFWPGPLTIIQERNQLIPAVVSSGLATVAIRLPAHPIAQALIKTAGVPIAAPSANLFSRPSATTAYHVLEDLDGRIDMILDGGPAIIGLESTVIDLVSQPPRLLRPGGISLEDLSQIIPNLEIVHKYLRMEEGEAASSPGLLTKHYSPKAALYLVKGLEADGISRIHEATIKFTKEGKKVGILAAREDIDKFLDISVVIADIGLKNDLGMIAANLFVKIRELDAKKIDVILVGEFELAGLGLAIRDRLVRAAEGKEI